MKVLTIFICLIEISLFAAVSFPTVPRDIPMGQESALVGHFRASINADDFASATPENPIFQRIGFTSGTLAHTLVDEGNDPIYLPLTLNSNSGELIAPSDTVAIVRWVAGEDYIWVQIQRSSSSWISVSGVARAPDPDFVVSYHLGYTAARITEHLDSFAEEKKNLPFPTHNLQSTRDQTSFALSSLICLNLSGISTEVISVGVRHYSSIHGDQTLDIQTSSGGALARQRVRDCEASIAGDSVTIHEGVVENQFSFTAQCETYIYLYMFPESYIELSVADTANYGFSENSIKFENEVDGFFEIIPESAFSHNNETYYRQARFHYTGTGIEILEEQVSISAMIQVTNAEEIILNYSIVLYDEYAPQDQSPFDGDAQHRSCGISTYTLGSGQWRMATTENDQLVPHLTSANGGFNTSLIFNNHSDEAQTVTAQAYTASGDVSTSTEVTLLAGETQKLSAQTLFEDENAAHCRLITNENVKTVIQYQLDAENSGPAHGRVDGKTSKTWTFFGGKESRTWDGFAVVNQGAFATTISCTQYASDGSVLSTITLASDVAPNQKVLGLISDYFTWVEGAKYVIEADQALSLIALRGDHSSLFLWQNAAIAQ